MGLKVAGQGAPASAVVKYCANRRSIDRQRKCAIFVTKHPFAAPRIANDTIDLSEAYACFG